MPRAITQEAFDEVVKENVEDFGMAPMEAADDAVEQFRAQGADLKNIITNPSMRSESEHCLKKNLDTLTKSMDQQNPKIDVVLNSLLSIRNWCAVGVPFQLLAARLGAYNKLIAVLDHYYDELPVRSATANALTSLMAGYPDLLDAKGVELMFKCLKQADSYTDVEIHESVVAALEWARECCLIHEDNRQKLITAGLNSIISDYMWCINSGILTENTSKAKAARNVLIKVCMLIKSLTLDDDVRAEISRAHEHARVLATENLCILTELLEKVKGDKDLCEQILGTLSALVVRNEFCEKVDTAGGIRNIFDILTTYPDDDKVNMQCLRLMKVLAGNDDVKAHLMEFGAAPLLLASMSRHQGSPRVSAAGCSCIAALALRSPNNSQILVDNGAADIILTCMKIHNKVPTVQRPACLAVRNIVSRSKDLCNAFLAVGVEEVLNSLDKATCGDEAKAALRDLGCHVKLEEPFTGTGTKLQR